jgi:SAM-dependent methyltransferase
LKVGEEESGGYAARIEAERETYRDRKEVHDLPPICFYWLNRYILPELREFGYPDAHIFFLKNLLRATEGGAGKYKRFLSIGAGNCDTEVRLAAGLLDAGVADFTIDCLDLNEAMLQRGVELAASQGIGARIHPICADFNAWQPAAEYDGIIANQALHHVVELESLMQAMHGALGRQGLLIVSDMIGRNGHRRWPEALPLVEQFWRELPEAYHYNHQLRRQEADYPDWDCSQEGFEGIRSQDILPLLLERFAFRFFYAFSNVTDPFIDRSYGPNFDAENAMDRAFIDRVHACDTAGIQAGRIKPTHMLAVLSRDADAAVVCSGQLTPEFCIRKT